MVEEYDERITMEFEFIVSVRPFLYLESILPRYTSVYTSYESMKFMDDINGIVPCLDTLNYWR